MVTATHIGSDILTDDLLNKLLARISYNSASGCWLWTGARNGVKKTGYGRFTLATGKQVVAHRLIYTLFKGPIPDGLCLDHLCRVRHCVNPEHLEPVTELENIKRGEAGRNEREKTHCPRGHPFSGENLYLRPQGYRECRICKREHLRKCRARTAVAQRDTR